jgi:hypothetical protein
MSGRTAIEVGRDHQTTAAHRTRPASFAHAVAQNHGITSQAQAQSAAAGQGQAGRARALSYAEFKDFEQ